MFSHPVEVAVPMGSVALSRVALSRSPGPPTSRNEHHCCRFPIGTIDVRGSGRTGADSGGTAVPIGSVKLSRVTLSPNSCSESSSTVSLWGIEEEARPSNRGFENSPTCLFEGSRLWLVFAFWKEAPKILHNDFVSKHYPSVLLSRRQTPARSHRSYGE